MILKNLLKILGKFYMKKVEVKLAVQNLEKAFDRLKEAVEYARDDLDKDGTIQRFEFVSELLWKTLKISLDYNKLQCRGPRDCIKLAFKYGYLEDDEIILDMIDDRNESSLIYDEKTSEEIFNRIKNVYVNEIQNIIAVIREKTL